MFKSGNDFWIGFNLAGALLNAMFEHWPPVILHTIALAIFVFIGAIERNRDGNL